MKENHRTGLQIDTDESPLNDEIGEDGHGLIPPSSSYPIGMPSASYFNTIQAGYGDNNLDIDALFDALDYSEQHRQLLQHADGVHGQQLALEPENLEEQDYDEPGFELKM